MRGQVVAKRHCGFTLVELIVVLVLISVSLALAAPTISHSIERAQFRKDVRSVTTMLTLTRSQAITQKIPYGTYIDHDNLTVWVDPYKKNRENPTKDATQTYLSNTNTLRVVIQKRSETKGISALIFHPNGSSSGGTFEMHSPRKKDSIEIKLNILTGLFTSKPLTH